MKYKKENIENFLHNHLFFSKNHLIGILKEHEINDKVNQMIKNGEIELSYFECNYCKEIIDKRTANLINYCYNCLSKNLTEWYKVI